MNRIKNPPPSTLMYESSVWLVGTKLSKLTHTVFYFIAKSSSPPLLGLISFSVAAGGQLQCYYYVYIGAQLTRLKCRRRRRRD